MVDEVYTSFNYLSKSTNTELYNYSITSKSPAFKMKVKVCKYQQKNVLKVSKVHVLLLIITRALISRSTSLTLLYWAATNDYFYYRLKCWLFSLLIYLLFDL